MRTSFYIGVAVAAVTLAGCTVGPNYKRPRVAVPQSFRAPEPVPESQGASLADLKWFEVFREEKPFDEEDLLLLTQIAKQVAIALDNAMAYEQIKDLKGQLARENLYLEDEIRTEMHFHEIVGNTAVLRNVLQQIEIVAPSPRPIHRSPADCLSQESLKRLVYLKAC